MKKNKRLDKAARWVITIGGMAVIVSVIAILFLIVKVTLPLFRSPDATLLVSFSPAARDASPLQPMAIGIDEYLETGYLLEKSGRLLFFDTTREGIIDEKTLTPPGRPEARLAAVGGSGNEFTLVWEDGGESQLAVSFAPRFDEQGVRHIEHSVSLAHYPPAADRPAADPIKALSRTGDDGTTRVTLWADSRFTVERQVTTTSLFGDETTETSAYEIVDDIPGPLTAFTVDRSGSVLFAGTAQGMLLRWELGDDGAVRTDAIAANDDRQPISALAMVFGSESLAVGDAAGRLSTWMMVRSEERAATKKLHCIHRLKSRPRGVSTIVASRRDKSLATVDQQGGVALDHMTSERHLLELTAARPLRLISYAPRGNGILALDDGGTLHLWAIDNPHPEISFTTLFGKVWYEGYDQKAYVWQSSASSDDAEPKFSITPLIFGTIKGTLYAMVFAVPLAIFGAVYLSQFSTPGIHHAVKPTIEIMASVPSVVIGFLIALWLAPIIEDWIVALLLALVLVPGCFVLFMVGWQAAQRFPRVRNMRKGLEFLLLIPVVVAALLLAYALRVPVEQALFGGDFKLWLYNTLGTRYDQRNCIIIAFGLGFTVIPIIFSMTEDAISNVPSSLAAASLALGASRWQTVWRVMLPSASPGIFAAVMIGFGRAVGETMIVLMATGNTPIMDWSIFNGMRTLSANIAVEIPEAPVGGTLYRVLFLCAVLLFAMTFVLNTGAELIRERLRRKYGRH